MFPASRRTVTTNEEDMLRSSPQLINDHDNPEMTDAVASEMFAEVVPCCISDGSTSTLTIVARTELIRSEEHTSELQSRRNLVCRLLLEKKKTALATCRLVASHTTYTR